MSLLATSSGRFQRILSLFVVACVLVPASSRAQSTSARISVVRSDARGVVLRVAGLRPDVRREAGGLRIGHNAPRFTSSTDSSSLPSLSITVAVPFGAADFAVVASDARAMTLRIDGAIANPHPSAPSRVGPVRVIRNNATVTVHHDPLKLSAAGVMIDTAFTLTLTWTPQPDAALTSKDVHAESPGVDRALSALIVNYRQSAQWRRARVPALRLQGTSGWGIGEAVVLSVPSDGVYHVSAIELTAAGASSIIGTPVDRIAVQHRGTPIPIRVADVDFDGALSPPDVIEFVGERNRGIEGFYFDAVTDTNAYILSWDGRAGQTPRIAPAALPADAPALVAYDSTLHFERDSVDFLGFSMPNDSEWGGEVRTLYVPERVSGERYHWLRVRGVRAAGEKLAFDCAPVLDANTVYTLRISLVNANSSEIPVTVALNDYAVVGTYNLPPRSDTMLVLTIPPSYLLNGANTLGFSVDLGTSREFLIYVDYFELKGRWRPVANDVTARVRIPTNAVAGSPMRVRINGLRTPATVAVGHGSRVAVDSSAIGGVRFRLTSRLFYTGAMRINHGFQAQFGDTIVRGPVWGLGIVVAEVDPAGRLLRSEFFGSYHDASQLERVAQFLSSISNENFAVAGSTGGFGPHVLPQSLVDALDALGSTVASKPGYDNGAWALVARKGDRTSVHEAFEPLAGPESNGVTLDEWYESSEGTSYRGVLTIAGEPGEEFVIGEPTAAGVRYHARDELVDPSNRADLVIVTHRAFREQAERLAAHRRMHGPADDADFMVKVVDVETVYDEFGHGIKHQLTIRSFLQYADTNWTAPAPWYVVLFGDASSDPQRRLGDSRMIDYVPTFGEPASDYWYTMPFGGVNPEVSQRWPHDTATSFRQVIGRLPAMSPREAADMVDKIIEYDTMAPARWNKRVVFIAGGSNLLEVENNLSLATTIARDYLTIGSFLGDTALVWRREFSGLPTTPPHPDSRWAQQEMAKGGLWVNSAGHGSRTVLDLDFGQPEEIDNQNRYFVLGTYSCETGAFSDHQLSLRNEDFLKIRGRGAIGTFGSTSWSYSHLNVETQQNIFALLTADSGYVNNLGALTTFAKWQVFDGLSSYWMLSGLDGFMRRNHLLSYSLLGDPSQDMKVSRKRELAFENAAITNGRGGDLSVDDTSALIGVDLWNYGRPILARDNDGDTAITVVGTIIGADGAERRDTFTVRWLERSQRVALSLPLSGKPGEYTVRIEADPAGEVDEGYRADNVIVLPLRVRGNQALPLEPIPNGRVAGYDDITIRLLNPPSGPGAEITIDTVPTFDSPAAFTSSTIGSMSSDDLTTTWTLSMPQGLRAARRFWWRAIASSGDPEIARLFPLEETFTVEADPRAEFMIGDRRQMARAQIRDVLNTDEGVGPGSSRARVTLAAIGQSRYPNGEDIDASKINIVVNTGSGSTRRLSDDNLFGLHIAVLDPETLELVPGMYRQFFLFERPEIADSIVAFISTIPAAHPVLVGTMGRAFDNVRESVALQAALASLGAQLISDSIGVDDSYALIGGKGMPAVQSWVFGEALRRAKSVPPFYAVAQVESEYHVRPSAGTLTTPTIGPATAWRTARIVVNDAGAIPDISVIGVRRDGVRDSLGLVGGPTTIDLGFVDVARYPRLELRAHFAADSTSRVRAIEVDFDPSPELAIVPRSIDTDKDSVLQGDPATLALMVANLSRRHVADSVAVALSHRSQGDPREVGRQIIAIAPMERKSVEFALQTDRFGSANHFVAQLNPGDVPAEPYRHNNADTATMRAGVDTTRPKLAVFADGQRLMDGDFVSPTARFEIRLFDNSLLPITDSTAIDMFVDLEEITLDSGAVFTGAQGGQTRAVLSYSKPAPGLSDGEHTITFMATDASGNRTQSEFVRFFVERELRLAEVVNYPNPMRDRSEFTFLVAGGSQPTRGEIAIYTVSGRKIKSIELGPTDVHLGFNHIEWDGLDEDRDHLANGVYLYRVMVESVDGRVEAIEKLVVMR